MENKNNQDSILVFLKNLKDSFHDFQKLNKASGTKFGHNNVTKEKKEFHSNINSLKTLLHNYKTLNENGKINNKIMTMHRDEALQKIKTKNLESTIDACNKKAIAKEKENIKRLASIHKPKIIQKASYLVERIKCFSESIDGLEFHSDKDNPPDISLFLSTENFLIDILVKDIDLVVGEIEEGNLVVKICHTCDDESERLHTRLSDALCNFNFNEFFDFVTDLIEFYNIADNQTERNMLYHAFQSLSNDIREINKQELQKMSMLDVIAAGHGLFNDSDSYLLKFVYFISPASLTQFKHLNDKFDEKTFFLNYGISASLQIDIGEESLIASQPRVLPSGSENPDAIKINDIITLKTLENGNSAKLNASYCIRLDEPLPISMTIANEINNLLASETQKPDNKSKPSEIGSSLEFFLLGGKTNGSDHSSKYLSCLRNVKEQKHHYCFSEDAQNPAIIFEHARFSDISYFLSILNLLRKQTMYNLLIESCRSDNEKAHPKTDLDSIEVFEVSGNGVDIVYIVFQYPEVNAIVSMEIRILTKGKVQVLLSSSTEKELWISNEIATKIVEKTFSIPLTMYQVFKLYTRSQPSLSSAVLNNKRSSYMQNYSMQDLPNNKKLKEG